jgi:hypothetical protein
MTVVSMTTGATSGGAITQIVARGAADFHLTGAATVTYWRLKHSTHTNFACEPISQSFTSAVQFGASSDLTLARTGDLIHRQYIMADLPGLYPTVVAGSTSAYAYVLDAVATASSGYMPDAELAAGLTNPLGGYYCHWVQAVGFALIKTVQLVVGGHTIDTLFSDYLYAWEELSGKAGKRLQDMIGKFETREQLIAYSRRPQRLYIPIPFWYASVAGNALSLVSLAFHGVRLVVDFEELSKLIVVSNKDIKVMKTDANGASTGREIVEADLNACVMTEYVYLDVSERNRFSQGLFDQLIHCVQCHVQTTTEAQLQMQLLFNHPVIQLIWMARLDANTTANQRFNYSRVGPAQGSGSSGFTGETKIALQPQTEGTFDVLVEAETVGEAVYGTAAGSAVAPGNPDLVSNDGMYNLSEVVTTNADPISSVGLRVNSLQRFATMEGKYFRQVQPYQHHSAIPKGFIYTFSFALHPEDPQPSGALNFSRLDNVTLDLTFHADVVGQGVTVMVFARNWNVFSYVDGIGGNKFQS